MKMKIYKVKVLKWMVCATIVCCFMASCKPDRAEVSLTRDNRFTGRGNLCETLLTLDILPRGEDANAQNKCVLKSVTCKLHAAASDVDALCICVGDEVIGRVEVKEGKNDYEIACHRVVTDSTRFRLTADINIAATEGERVSADITSVRFRGSSVVPDNPEPGAREILLCRKCLYRPGDYGSLFWRIPAIRQLSDGTLLTVNDRRNLSEDD
ncbi:MAG: sialidase family protein [Bacteroidales bacterium]|nr:sialidase family protein [Bacteroidales bacterium]